VKKIFVDGGFSRNSIFMNLLARIFPDLQVYAARVAQASAIGAAMAIHQSWNGRPFAENLISLESFSPDSTH
jgi:sugar (pentulose or hexulose) kinase